MGRIGSFSWVVGDKKYPAAKSSGQKPLAGKRLSKTASFFHPDFSRRRWNYTSSYAFERSWGFTTGREFHPAPKEHRILSIFYHNFDKRLGEAQGNRIS